MALIKTDTSVYSDQVLSAGGGPTISAWQNVEASYETQVHLKLLNGASITIPAKIEVEVASNTSTGKSYDFTPTYEMSITNGDEKSWTMTLPMAVEHFRIVATHATGGTVTMNVEYTRVTGI